MHYNPHSKTRLSLVIPPKLITTSNRMTMCVYICIVVGYPNQKGVGIPMTGLIPPHFLYPCPKSANGFPTPYVVIFFVCNDLRWVVVVRFVDICGMFYHHRFNILFISWNKNYDPKCFNWPFSLTLTIFFYIFFHRTCHHS